MNINDEIKRASDELNLTIEFIRASDFQQTLLTIKEKYTNRFEKGRVLWEILDDFAAVQDEHGWSYIGDFVQNKPCIMFISENRNDTRNGGFIIRSGNDLTAILAESYGFEFYVTNTETDYLICFNDHNCLLGCGRAKKWVNQFAKKKSPK